SYYIFQSQQSNALLVMGIAARYAQSLRDLNLAHGVVLISHSKLYRHTAPYALRCRHFADRSLAILSQTCRSPALLGLKLPIYDVVNSSVTCRLMAYESDVPLDDVGHDRFALVSLG